jgi:hypothetical protein
MPRPQGLLRVEEAIDAALGNVTRGEVESTWTDAWRVPGDPEWAGGTHYKDERSTNVDATAGAVFTSVCRVGGKQGWYSADWLWRLRGFIDRLAGGPGLSRGRRHADRVEFGDVLDFWRVTGVEPDRRLELRAEMKLPGEALLEFLVEPGPDNAEGTRLRQVARFKPRGLGGVLYWYSVKPIHGFVFNRMLHGIKRAVESRTGR